MTLSLGGGDRNRYAGSTGALALGRWHLVAGVVRGNTIATFIDGVRDVGYGGTFSGTRQTGLKVTIGAGNTASAYGFPGLIDEARIYNRALSAAEVQALYTGPPGDD